MFFCETSIKERRRRLYHGSAGAARGGRRRPRTAPPRPRGAMIVFAQGEEEEEWSSLAQKSEPGVSSVYRDDDADNDAEGDSSSTDRECMPMGLGSLLQNLFLGDSGGRSHKEGGSFAATIPSDDDDEEGCAGIMRFGRSSSSHRRSYSRQGHESSHSLLSSEQRPSSSRSHHSSTLMIPPRQYVPPPAAASMPERPGEQVFPPRRPQRQPQQGQAQVQVVGGRAAAREEEAWRPAIDPTTGRVYYFEASTRRVQWEKPARLVLVSSPQDADDEEDPKARKRRKDRALFREMEENIRRSLAAGRPAPGCQVPPSAFFSSPPGTPDGSDGAGGADGVNGAGVDGVMSKWDAAGTRSPTSVAEDLPSPPAPPRKSTDDRVASSTSPVQAASSSRSTSSSCRDLVEMCRESVESDLRRESEDLVETRRRSSAGDLDLLSRGVGGGRGTRGGEGGTLLAEGRSHLFRPDVAATVRCVCAMFREHMLRRDVSPRSSSSSSGSPFSSASAPRPFLLGGRDPAEVFDDDYGDGTAPLGALLPSPRSRRAILRKISEATSGLLESFGEGDSASGDDHEGNKEEDDDSNLPSLRDIITFFAEFYRRAKMEPDAVIVSFLYVLRLVECTKGAVRPDAHNWRSVLLSCMCLASKVWDDLSMWNADFAEVCKDRTRRPPLAPRNGRRGGRGGRHPHLQRYCQQQRQRQRQSASSDLGLSSFTLARINLLERTLLRCLDFDASVSAASYAALYFRVRGMSLRGGDRRPASAPSERVHQGEEEAAAPVEAEGRRAGGHHHDYGALSRASRGSVRLEEALTMC